MSGEIKQGPLWQIEQQIKHYRGLETSFRADSILSLEKAERAEKTAIEYEKARDILKDAMKATKSN